MVKEPPRVRCVDKALLEWLWILQTMRISFGGLSVEAGACSFAFARGFEVRFNLVCFKALDVPCKHSS